MPITHHLPRYTLTPTRPAPKVAGTPPAVFSGTAPVKSAHAYTPPRNRQGTSLPSPLTTPHRTPTRNAVKRKDSPTTPVPDSKRPALAAPKTSSTKTSKTSVDTAQLRNDRLGTLVKDLCKRFYEASSWEEFVNEFRGPSYLAQDLDNVDHPAAELLRHWRDEGVPAETTSPPWTTEQRDACVERGCHQSANQHSEFL